MAWGAADPLHVAIIVPAAVAQSNDVIGVPVRSDSTTDVALKLIPYRDAAPARLSCPAHNADWLWSVGPMDRCSGWHLCGLPLAAALHLMRLRNARDARSLEPEAIVLVNVVFFRWPVQHER